MASVEKISIISGATLELSRIESKESSILSDAQNKKQGWQVVGTNWQDPKPNAL
jgi:hypothetical protein